MALFIAVAPAGLENNNELKTVLTKLKRTMKDQGKEARWTPSNLWHISLQFLGNLPATEKVRVIEFFQSWSLPDEALNIELRMQGVGAFPSVEHARVLWLGVQKNQSLLNAQSALSASLQSMELDRDEREYTPHLTLARFRNPINASSLVELAGRKHFGDYSVKELILFESVIEGNMAKYVPLSRKPLRPSA